MSDGDLEQIRRARIQQLQQQQQSSSSSPNAQGTHDGQSSQQVDREAEARRTMLSQILTPDAADRLNRIRLVKEARATDVEDRLIMAARQGGLRGKIGEDELKGLLTKLSDVEGNKVLGQEGGENSRGGMRVVRRKGWEEDDELDDLDNFS